MDLTEADWIRSHLNALILTYICKGLMYKHSRILNYWELWSQLKDLRGTQLSLYRWGWGGWLEEDGKKHFMNVLRKGKVHFEI